MSISKPERLTNLVIGLLSTRQFVTAERISKDFAGYQDCPNKEAFDRMFERDKAELRDLGIPLASGKSSSLSEEIGYRIDRSEYELPPIELTREESAAVAVAGQLWRSPDMAAAYAAATVKLRAAGIPVEDTGMATVVGNMGHAADAEPALADLVSAVDAGRAVRFTHLAAGEGTTQTRTVEPWAVISNKGRWYLVGHDRDRQAVRTFRLSRIVGAIEKVGADGAVHVPSDADPRAIALGVTEEPTSPGIATLWLADDHAQELRRIGTEIGTRSLAGRPGTIVEIPVGPRTATVRTIAGHSADAVVLTPADLRSEVVDTLVRSAGAHGSGAHDNGGARETSRSHDEQDQGARP